MLRSLILGAVSAFALVSAAGAADMYRGEPMAGGYKDGYVPVATWTGFYVGVNGGYGWSADDSKLSATANGQSCNSVEIQTCTPVSGSGAKKFGTSGGFGGGQIGYNWQPMSGGGYKDAPASSRFVFGVEADIQGSGIDGDTSLSLLGGTASAKAKNELEWFGTVRGRVGYSFDRSLLYFTGGFALGGVKDTLTLKPAVGASSAVSKSATNTGFVLGGGVEHLLNPAWSVKVEYQYIDLGSDKLATTAGAAPFAASAFLDAEHTYHTVRIGLNYHIGPSYEPLK